MGIRLDFFEISWKMAKNSEKMEVGMTKAELVKKMAEKVGRPQKEVEKVLSAFMEVVKETLSKGETVTLVGFGTFYPSQMNARKVRNPRTGETMDVPARKLPRFRAGKDLREALKG